MTTKLAKFTQEDIDNLKVLTQLQLEADREAVLKFYALAETQPTSRILHKEAIPGYLQSFSSETNKSQPKISLKSRAGQIFRNELPHMASVFESKPSPIVEEKKTNDLGNKFNLPQVPINNQQTTGTSITHGNYINLSKQGGPEKVPTWKQVQNNGGDSNFYADAFNLNNKKRTGPDGLADAINQSAQFLTRDDK